VDQSEVEKLIGELETALDRLRSLYEQYFVGIERIEPAVVRKDVDRRLYVLRKEQIRNTALRYRFQMLLQKYNTYQTHWQRVCREIENGTYKRHLLRAQRRFGSSRPPRRRSSMLPPDPRPEPGAPLPQDLAAELAELDREFAPASVDVEIPFDDKPSSRPPPRPTPRPPVVSIPPSPGLPSSAFAAPPAPRPVAAGGSPVWKKVGPGAPGPSPAQGAPSPWRGPAAPSPPPPHPSPAGPQPPLRAMPPVGLPPAPPPARRPSPPGGPAQPPARPAATAAPSAPKAAPPAHPRPDGPQSVPRPVQAGAPPAPPPRAQPPRPNPSSPPPRPPSFAPPRPAPAPGELSDKRLRQIYVEYVDARRRQNESTAAITYQSVAKSLRESEDKLRQRHGKDVDFEVAVKDGKTILRPVLK
jgi:hypothetical protein